MRFLRKRPKKDKMEAVEFIDTERRLRVSTVENHGDCDCLYETAISSPFYKEGKLIVVEEYETWGEAEEGHKRWIRIMTHSELPSCLVEVSTSVIVGIKDLVEGSGWRRFPKEEQE